MLALRPFKRLARGTDPTRVSFVGDIGSAGGIVIGALGQLVNAVMGRVPIPVGPLSGTPVGDVFEPFGNDQRTGADGIDALLGAITGAQRIVDARTARLNRPLLAAATVTVAAAGDVTRIRFDASVAGADWASAGRESTLVAVYVDGRYHATVIVMAERTGGYAVNLGALPPGVHRIELRSASAQAGVHAPTASVKALRGEAVTGDQAEIERHAPVLQLRDDERGARHSASHTDAPLLLVPNVIRRPDGSRTIEYRVVFSNEDGGTATPNLLAKYGRSVDNEPIYRVTIAADGRVIGERYQATLHHWRRFDGERANGRPVLRVSTANNLVSTRVQHGAERWSDAAIAPVADGTSDSQLMRANPWTWAVMGKELLREGKVHDQAVGAARRAGSVADPRRYLYLSPLGEAARAAIAAAGGITLVLSDGRRIVAKVAASALRGAGHATALELPLGAVADAIVGVALLGVDATVLDARFRPRVLQLRAVA